MNEHKNLVECAESLIRRLETIRETNPEICLKDDIEFAKKAVSAHYSKFFKNVMAIPEEPELPEGTLDYGHIISKRGTCTAMFWVGHWNSDELFAIADYVRFKKEAKNTHVTIEQLTQGES